jgi:hypothetical protein
MQTLKDYYDERRKLLDKYYWHKFELRKASETCDNCVFGFEIKSGKYAGDYCCKARKFDQNIIPRDEALSTEYYCEDFRLK